MYEFSKHCRNTDTLTFQPTYRMGWLNLKVWIPHKEVIEVLHELLDQQVEDVIKFMTCLIVEISGSYSLRYRE